MCCFTRQVQKVSETHIFARPATDGRQFLVYSMTLKAKEDLAMVLPLPVKPAAGEKAVSFIDLKDYAHFFDDLGDGFDLRQYLKSSRVAPDAAALRQLEVVQVGSFEASYVPTIKDFSRLDARFRLPSGVWEKLPAYRNYGFAVFKLKPGTATIHPMAF